MWRKGELFMRQESDGFSAGMLQRIYERILFQDKTLSIQRKIRMLDQLFTEQSDRRMHEEAMRRVKDLCAALKQMGIQPEMVTFSELTGEASHTGRIVHLDS